MAKIILAAGEGGKLTRELVEGLIYPQFKNKILKPLTDSAILDSIKNGEIAFTTDSYIVSPIFFNGGDIGSLSISGTVNDLTMAGAIPIAVSYSLIIEEGFEEDDLKRILKSSSLTAKKAKVKVVTGDTKVLPKGKGDGIFINTSGIGVILKGRKMGDERIEIGDKIIVSGDIGRHGATIAAFRHNLRGKNLSSDCQPLNSIVETLFRNGIKPNSLHDPTRGGVATLLNEVCRRRKVSIEIEEDKIPISKEVLGVCEILGLDPLYLACEGRFVGFFKKEDADKAVKILKKYPSCTRCSIIGEVKKLESINYPVILKTKLGSLRPIDELTTIQLPRIC